MGDSKVKRIRQSNKDGQDNRSSITGNGHKILAIAKRYAYLATPQAYNKYIALLEKEKRHRYELTMETDNIWMQIKARFSYYWSGKDSGIPSMSQLGDKILEKMRVLSDDLESKLTEIKMNQSRLEDYYREIHRDAVVCHSTMELAQEKRQHFRPIIADLETQLQQTSDIKEQLRLLGEKHEAIVEYSRNTIIYSQNGFRRDLRLQQMPEIHSTMGFVYSVILCNEVAISFQKVVEEGFNAVKFAYDTLAQTTRNQIELEQQQRRLNSKILGYKKIVAEMHELIKNNMSNTLQDDAASQIINNGIYNKKISD